MTTTIQKIANLMSESGKDKNKDEKEKTVLGQDATHMLSKWSPPSTKTMRAVAYSGDHKVTLKTIPYPQLANHGAILKIVASNICGSDLHMFRGRTSAPSGLILGHENTGIVEEVGSDVLFVKKGDLVSVPFNVACGRCDNCRAAKTNICLNVNPLLPGGIYGYVGQGDWNGGQADFLHVPFADFNLLVFTDKKAAMDKICDLALLSDALCTGFHGAVSAGVCAGDIVFIAGAGPIGLCCAASCQLLGAAMVVVGDVISARLTLAANMGCKIVDMSSKIPVEEQLRTIVGKAEVDKSVDCVGFEATGYGKDLEKTVPPAALNMLFKITRVGGCIGIPGAYFMADMLADSKLAKWECDLPVAWSKAHSLVEMGQVPVNRYNKQLAKCILTGKLENLSKHLNVTLIDLEDCQKAYEDIDKGATKKYIFDPHHIIRDHLQSESSKVKM
jgi:glutathione-independent formaldehyde dehydrogenase